MPSSRQKIKTNGRKNVSRETSGLTVRRTNLFDEFWGFRDWFAEGVDRASREIFSRKSPGLPEQVWSPLVDIYETDSEVVLLVELPGIAKEDVQTELVGNVLTISGEKKFIHQAEGQQYHQVECVYGPFERTFSMVVDIDSQGIKARFRNGVLKLTLPKKAKTEPQQIEVESK